MRTALLSTVVLMLTVTGIRQSAAEVVTFQDPLGDTFGAPTVSHDLQRYSTSVMSQQIIFELGFAAPIAPPSSGAANSLVGFIDIDIDQNSATGAVSNQTAFSPNGASGLGTEFFLDLFSENVSPGNVELVRTSDLQTVERLPIHYGTNLLSIAVPLAALGDEGNVNFGVIIGDFDAATDEASNFGQPVAFSRRAANLVPEPRGLIVWLAALCMVLVSAAWRSLMGARRGCSAESSTPPTQGTRGRRRPGLVGRW